MPRKPSKKKVVDESKVVAAKPKRQSTPQGVYWQWTQYDLSWTPPVPYKEKENILVRYMIYQLEVCPETGNHHYQGYTQFYKKKYATQVQAHLNLVDCHCELEREDPPVSILYCSKLATRLDPLAQPFVYGIPNLVGAKGGRPKNGWQEGNFCYKTALAQRTKKEFLAMVELNASRDFVMSNQLLNTFADKKYAPPVVKPVARYKLESFNAAPQGALDWIRDEFPKTERALCLMLVGPSRTGKTQFAKSICENHVYWRGSFNLADWDDNAKLMIFDDIDYEKWTVDLAKTLVTQNGQATMTDKFMRKQTIYVNAPSIILCNKVPTWYFLEEDYWGVNIKVVRVTAKLYTAPQAEPVVAAVILPSGDIDELDIE